jgi:diguanylate cyclase (GGDEF)-like protein
MNTAETPDQTPDLVWLEVMRVALMYNRAPEKWPEAGGNSPGWRELVENILAIQRQLLVMAQGDLSGELFIRGWWAGILKTLQANLRHLTWQVQQVAAGDLTQHVDFMGEFSEAFNLMTDNLRRALEGERQQHLLDTALRDTAAALNSAMGLNEVFDVLLDNLGRLVPFDLAALLLISEDQRVNTTRCASSERLPNSALRECPEIPELLANLLQQMQDNPQPLWVATAETLPGAELMPWANSFLGAPILIKKNVVGYLCLWSTVQAYYTLEHSQRLEAFADQAAIAIDKARLFEQIRRQAITDPLTGIANRRHFFALAEEEFERSGRYGNALTFLMVDIDNFKAINDQAGHQAGDAVLKAVVDLCVGSLRSCDLIGRYGGEEFVIMLPQTSKTEAVKVAERLRQNVANATFSLPVGLMHVTVSIGVVQLLADGASLLTLLERADRAMYIAKMTGRNRVQVA